MKNLLRYFGQKPCPWPCVLAMFFSAWISWYLFSTLLTIFRPVKSTLCSVSYILNQFLPTNTLQSTTIVCVFDQTNIFWAIHPTKIISSAGFFDCCKTIDVPDILAKHPIKLKFLRGSSKAAKLCTGSSLLLSAYRSSLGSSFPPETDGNIKHIK